MRYGRLENVRKKKASAALVVNILKVIINKQLCV